MGCRFCGKEFSRGYNLRRHEKEYCPMRDQERDVSQIDEPDSDRDEKDYSQADNSSTTSYESHESETMTTSDNESEPEEELDPWIPMIIEAKERSHTDFEEMKEHLMSNGLDEESANNEASSNILPKLQRELENIYIERLIWMRKLKRDPVHKRIMHTQEEFMENDDFDPEEAIEAALDKRKFLIRRLLKDYNIFDVEDNNEDDN